MYVNNKVADAKVIRSRYQNKPYNIPARNINLTQKRDEVTFGSKKAVIDDIFKSLKKEVPAHKIIHVEKLQHIFEKLPVTEAAVDLAECLMKVTQGDYRGMGIQL